MLLSTCMVRLWRREIRTEKMNEGYLRHNRLVKISIIKTWSVGNPEVAKLYHGNHMSSRAVVRYSCRADSLLNVVNALMALLEKVENVYMGNLYIFQPTAPPSICLVEFESFSLLKQIQDVWNSLQNAPRDMVDSLEVLKGDDQQVRTFRNDQELPQTQQVPSNGSHNSVKQYKCRAECSTDILRALQHLLTRNPPVQVCGVQVVTPYPSEIPDCDLEFSSDMPMKAIVQEWGRNIEDSHVMWQSLELKERYTGDRNHWADDDEEDDDAE
jgi:hypothetical protein